MKKLLLFLLTSLVFLTGFSQINPNKVIAPGSTTKNMFLVRGYGRSDSSWGVPYRDTNYIPNRYGDIVVRPADNNIYFYLGHWFLIQSAPVAILCTNGVYAFSTTTLGLGGTLNQTTHISGSNNYGLYLDSLNLFMPLLGATIQSLDTTGRKLIVWNTTTGKFEVMSWQAASGGGSSANVQIFTGASGTWTKPSGCKMVWVRLVGPGGGGGSGAKGAAGTLRTGGAGGGAGGVTEYWFNASDLPSTVAYVAGTGGAGGAAQTTNSTNGNPGSAGSASSSFGGYLQAPAGAGGGAGNSSGAAAGGSGAIGQGNQGYAANGASSDAAGGVGGNATNVNQFQPSGGGAGGGITTGNTANNGGVFGSIGLFTNPSNNYGPTFAQGQAGVQAGSFSFGTGGSGNAASTSTNGGTGGNAYIGGGGGGGGAATNSVGNSGAGGSGGNGYVIIVSYF